MNAFVICLVLLLSVQKACSFVCLKCSSAIGAAECTTVKTCGPHEVCFSDAFSTASGIRREYGCRDSQMCTSQLIGRRRNSQDGLLACSQCCHGDVCNSKLCGETGAQSLGGPTCFACDLLQDPDACNHIWHCGRDEICELLPELSTVTHRSMFTSRCAKPQSCETQRDDLLMFSSGPVCGAKCCNTSLCNTDNCSQNSHTAVTSPSPTHATANDVSSCYDLLNKTGTHRSGVYNITTWRSHTTISLYCDMTTDGGGWTVFQRRLDGSVDFYRNFSEYENGFGSASGEYWLGLRTIQEMVGKASHELRIDVEGYDGSKGNDVYRNFRLQGPGYTFYVDNRTRSFNMTGRDNLSDGSSYSPYGQNFSTFDNDQDRILNASCAYRYHGAWWFNRCLNANLNGDYGIPGTALTSGIRYLLFLHLRAATMMFRPLGTH